MRLALFDLDHTLLSGDSDFEWGRFLAAQGVLDRVHYEAKTRPFMTITRQERWTSTRFWPSSWNPWPAFPVPNWISGITAS
jgi:hypothetical protein